MNKIKNGTWVPCQPGKTPKKRAKLCLCRPKYIKKGKWHKTKFSISFLNDMELWFEWSRFFIRYVEIHNGSFEMSGRIFRKFSMFHKKSKLFRKNLFHLNHRFNYNKELLKVSFKKLERFFRYFGRLFKKLHFEKNKGKVENTLKSEINRTPIYLNTKQENKIY